MHLMMPRRLLSWKGSRRRRSTSASTSPARARTDQGRVLVERRRFLVEDGQRSSGRERLGREAGHRPDLERRADDDQDARLPGDAGARECVDREELADTTTPG